uniref:Uncharacterized protein n=1 Tax=Arundo donax TaxID=35708 RepID=A0A0A8XSC5_ARUDO
MAGNRIALLSRHCFRNITHSQKKLILYTYTTTLRSSRSQIFFDFIHLYYYIDKFTLVYTGVIPPLTDQSRWPKVDLEFKLHPPILRRSAGRLKVQRYMGSYEGAAKGHLTHALYVMGPVIHGKSVKEGNLIKIMNQRKRTTISTFLSNLPCLATYFLICCCYVSHKRIKRPSLCQMS